MQRWRREYRWQLAPTATRNGSSACRFLIHIYIYVYIHTYVYIYIYICIYIYIHTYVCIYIYIYTHTYIYIYIYTWLVGVQVSIDTFFPHCFFTFFLILCAISANSNEEWPCERERESARACARESV